MTLDQLRIFLEVADREHVTRAAHVLNMTQSAVSAAVTSLEARHSVKLFNRVGRRIELTQAGRVFRHEAAAVLRRVEEAQNVLADLGGSASGTLRLHASQTVASYWLPPYLVRYRELFPKVDLRLQPGNTSTVAECVLQGIADLGVVEGEVNGPDFAKQRVAEDRLVLIVGSKHAWADKRRIQPADLTTTTWILREPGSGTRSAFEAELFRLKLQPDDLKTVLVMPSNEACLAAVEVGTSATVLSVRAAMDRLKSGNLHEVSFSFLPRSFTVLRHAERHATKAVTAMIELLSLG